MSNNEDADFDAPIEPLKRPAKIVTGAAPDLPRQAQERAAAAQAVSEKRPEPVDASDNMLSIVGEIKPIDVLDDEEKRAALYIGIGKEIAAQEVDLSTQAGRDRVKSFVYKITRTRTAVVAAGKQSTEAKRAEITATNKRISDAEAAFKLLEIEARKPLTAWELEEEKKADQRREILNDIARAISWAARENPPMTADEARELIAMVEEIAVDPDLWAGDAEMIVGRKAEAVRLLRLTVDAAEARAKMAAIEEENERLRAAQPAETKFEESYRERVEETQRTSPISQAAEVAGNDPPAAGTTTKELTPIQKARRLALPALAELGIDGDLARSLILAIEAGEIPGIAATYKD